MVHGAALLRIAALPRHLVRRCTPLLYRRAWFATESGRLGLKDRVGLFAEFAEDGAARHSARGPRGERDGFVTRIEPGSVRLAGLAKAEKGQLVDIPAASARGVIVALEEMQAEALLVAGDEQRISAGDDAQVLPSFFMLPAADELRGKVVTPSGEPLNEPLLSLDKLQQCPLPLLGRKAPMLQHRTPVRHTLPTGVKLIDAFFPLAHGSRALMVGSEGTGKSSLALQAAVNFLHLGGPSARAVLLRTGRYAQFAEQALEALRERGVEQQAVVVSAPAVAGLGTQYVAPFAATTWAESFRDAGHPTLLVVDAFSSPTSAYEQLSPSVRHALPSLSASFSDLLDRGCQLSDARGGGALTVVGVVDGEYADAERHALLAGADEVLQTSRELALPGMFPPVDARDLSAHAAPPHQARALRHLCGPLRGFLLAARRTERAADMARAFGLHDEGDTDVLTRERVMVQALMSQPARACVSQGELALLLAAARYGVSPRASPQRAWHYHEQLARFARAYAPEVLQAFERVPEGEKIPKPLAAMLFDVVRAFAEQYEG